MPNQPLADQLEPTSFRAPRPGLLIAFWVGALVVLLAFAWGVSWLINIGFIPFSPQFSLGWIHLQVIVPDGAVVTAWWLAMFVPHTKRSMFVPIALVAGAIVLRSGFGIWHAVRNFYTWSDFGQELWRLLAWGFAGTSLQMVCIGGLCYLVSRLASMQLNRSDTSPQPTTFDIRRIFGLTLLVAAVFAASRWSSAAPPTSLPGMLSSSALSAFAAISSVSIGVNWACLSWACATRSKRWIAVAVAGLLLFQFGLSTFSYWVLTRQEFSEGVEIAEPNYLLTASYLAASIVGILIAIRIAAFCGYRLNFYRPHLNDLTSR